ncbi:MAG: hypothetical protein WCT45_02485 [Candidatus Paceibacterota bacterium]|jgi:hypothetical protein
MIRTLATVLSFLSAIFFPWPLTACLAIGVSVYEPLVPLAIGIFADTLYYAPSTGAWPVLTLYGLLATILAFFVRSQLKTGIIGE